MCPSSEDPLAILPHRPPILCIDRILEVGESSARAGMEVRGGPWLRGEELWEGCIVEGLAQTAAAMANTHLRRAGLGLRLGLLVVVRSLEFRRRARLGEHVMFEVERIRDFGSLSFVSCRASAGEETLASGEMRFYVEAES